jgi:threonine aldolase
MGGYRVDLRSDTVTKPSLEMRKAMADAEVGDGWYGDDPTVNRLQEMAAEKTGHEAALYVATGTMANQIGLALHVHGGGHLVACLPHAHVATMEVATAAALSGIAYRTGEGHPRGWMTAELAARLLEPDTFYDVQVVDLLAVENTVAGAAGSVMPAEEMRAVRKVADQTDTPIYLDGARIFNAAEAAGMEVAEWTREADTAMFCLSKGLGAPIGSVLCGSAEMMREARRLWILFGGAWRQAGVVAAAGIVALQRGPGLLAADHARARRLALELAELIPGSVDPDAVETNMLLVDPRPAGLDPLDALERLAAQGVGATFISDRVRMVTHLDIDDEAVDLALVAWRTIVEAASGSGAATGEA